MSDMTTQPTEPTETVAEEQHNTTQEVDLEQYPADHPLVKTLAAQKAQLKELKELGEFKELKQFKELQAKAARLDEIEEAQKSEAEKVADRLAKADAEVAAVPAKVSEGIKALLVALDLVDKDDAELLTATEPDLLLKQAERLVGLSGKRKNIVPHEGRTTNPAPVDPNREFLRAVTGQS